MKLYFGLFLSVFVFACSPILSEEIRENTDTSLTFKEVARNPDTYRGKIVLWGGEIIQTLPQKDGSIFIEVLEWPLGWTGRPRRTVSFQGEFLVLLTEPSELSIYRPGVKITIAGEIQGSIQGKKIESVSNPAYRYPLLLGREIHVWKYRLYPYSSVPDYRTTWEYRHYEGILRY